MEYLWQYYLKSLQFSAANSLGIRIYEKCTTPACLFQTVYFTTTWYISTVRTHYYWIIIFRKNVHTYNSQKERNIFLSCSIIFQLPSISVTINFCFRHRNNCKTIGLKMLIWICQVHFCVYFWRDNIYFCY